MSEPAIKVEGLSKRYRIGVEEEQHDTLFGALSSWVKSPVENYRRVKRLSSFGEDEADDIIWALDDVSFEVERGEVVGVIGRNGAGKSTLLKILSHITEPTSGYAKIRGRVSSLLEVGTGFHPELTGRENVYLNGTILGMSKAEVDRKFDEIVAFSGVEQFIDTPVKRYSSGMKVRLGFAVAAHLEPEILLIDEVLAVGDHSFQKKCLGKMDKISDSGRTVFFVSHNMGMIRSLCPRTILLENGRVAMDNSTGRVVSHYLEAESYRDEIDGQIEWSLDEAPGGDEVKLRSVRILTPDGYSQGTHDANNEITLEIVYDVQESVRGMRLVLTVLTQEGQVAFASTNHLAHPDIMEVGSYRTRCVIPAGLLNCRQYKVKVHAGVPGVKKLVPATECLTLTVAGANVHGSHYPENWPGAVAPDLDWTTERLRASATYAS